MIVTPRDLEYLQAVNGALEDGERIQDKHMTDQCPECGYTLTWDYSGGHIVFPVSDDPNDTERRVIVVIACEGYWVIDPRPLGMPWYDDNWQDWTEEPPITGGCGCTGGYHNN